MKRSRIAVLAFLVVVFAIVISGEFGVGDALNKITLAGYGGTSTDDDKPELKHTAVTQATVGEKINLEAKAEDDDSGIDEVKLYYRVNGGSWSDKKMNHGSGHKYTGSIPAQSNAGTVEYYIRAEDKAGNKDYSGSGGNPHRIKIVASRVSRPAAPRVITNTPTTPPPANNTNNVNTNPSGNNGTVNGTEDQNNQNQNVTGDNQNQNQNQDQNNNNGGNQNNNRRVLRNTAIVASVLVAMSGIVWMLFVR